MFNFDKLRFPSKQRLNQHSPTRRMLMLTGLGSAISVAACSKEGAGASAQENDVADEIETSDDDFNSWDRTREYLNNEMDSGEPWIAPKHGNFDLTDPVENNLVRIKMPNNLVGARTYIPMLMHCYLGREQNPGAFLYGGAALFAWQLQVPDPAEYPGVPEGTALLRTQYTAVYLDPKTMEPAEELINPITGNTMKLKDYIFVEQFLLFPNGGGRFVEEPQMLDDVPTEPKLSLITTLGDELVLHGSGIYREPGIHQPRYTDNIWRSPKDQVMDPDVGLTETSFTFLGINKAYEKPWTGYTKQDKEFITTLASGKKVHSVDDIPDFHKRVIVDKYPHRV